MCFPFSLRRGNTWTNLTPTRSWDSPVKLFTFIVHFCPEGCSSLATENAMDASFLLAIEVFLLTVCLFYLRWGDVQAEKTKPISFLKILKF